ncbi:MAG TPA: Tim44/TimA family putative adaptor protein [Hyphomicrobiaceae bacterium]|jgi:predicted lipid-binding transport protein (Tim44 family)
MDGRIDVITLLFLIVAVVVILKLRSVLGRRTGDEEARYERQLRAQQEARERAAAAKGKVVALPRREREAATVGGHEEVAAADAETRVKNFAGGNTFLEQALLHIARADASFDPEQFLRGAKQAYEMIVMAFAEGNRKLLKDLLSREVFDSFVAAISDRESRGEQIDQSFVGINKAEIVEAELKGSTAQVTVKFVSQLISATRDSAGHVISGDPQRIREVTDIWTFAREVTSRNPNWRLIATQAP